MIRIRQLAATSLLAVALVAPAPASAQDLSDVMRAIQNQQQNNNQQPNRNSNSRNNGQDIATVLGVATQVMSATEQSQLANRLANSPTDPTPSANQQQLYSYTRNYRVQGGIAGAAVGAILGCVIANNTGKTGDCGKGALVGGMAGMTVGIVAGGAIAKRQQTYASRETNLKDKLMAAQADYEDAHATRVAAEKLVVEHRASIAKLKAARAANRITRDEMATEVGYMMKDVESLQAAQKGLQGQILSVNKAIASAQPGPDRDQMQAVYDKLRREDAAMTVALRDLGGAVEQVQIA